MTSADRRGQSGKKGEQGTMGGLDKGEVPSVRGENGSDPQPLGNGDKGQVCP